MPEIQIHVAEGSDEPRAKMIDSVSLPETASRLNTQTSHLATFVDSNYSESLEYLGLRTKRLLLLETPNVVYGSGQGRRH